MLPTTRPVVALSILLLFLGLLFGQQKTSSNAQEITETTNSEIDLKLRNIINNIEQRQFSEADRRILEMGISPTQIAIIVNAITDVDFLIQNYIRRTSEISISTAFADALCNQMESTGQLNVYTLMDLKTALSTNYGTNKRRPTDEITFKTISTINRIRNLITPTAAKVLSKAALEGNYHSENIEALASTLLSFDEKISDRIMILVKDEVCRNMTSDNAVRTLFSKKRVSQSIMVLREIYYKSRFTDGVDPMLMTEYLSILQKMPDYANLPIQKRTMATNLVWELPEDIRNLYFGDRVCIRNVRHSEYLSPALLTQLEHDILRTCTSPKEYVQYHWIPKKCEQERVFEFATQFNASLYLNVPGFQRIGEQHRNVMISVTGGSLDKKSKWQISRSYGNFLIRNEHFNETLCTDENGLKFLPWQRMVFTETEEHVHGGCEWTFERC